MINARTVPDERVRKAILYPFDRKAIADAYLYSQDYYELGYTFLPPGNPFYTDEVEHYDRDVEKAKALLAEAGQEGLTPTITYSSSDSLEETAALMMQEQAAEAGIAIFLQSMDPAAEWQQIMDPDNTLELYYTGYVRGIDPDTYWNLFTSYSASPKNFMYYEYPDIDELFRQGREQIDENERRATYNEAQAAVQQTACFYPLYSNKRLLVTSKRVKDVDEAKLVAIYTFEDMSELDVE